MDSRKNKNHFSALKSKNAIQINFNFSGCWRKKNTARESADKRYVEKSFYVFGQGKSKKKIMWSLCSKMASPEFLFHIGVQLNMKEFLHLSLTHFSCLRPFLLMRVFQERRNVLEKKNVWRSSLMETPHYRLLMTTSASRCEEKLNLIRQMYRGLKVRNLMNSYYWFN